MADACFADKNTADLENLRVLVVDDNATNRRILEEVLAGWGSRTESVDSGASALTVIQAASSRGEPFVAAVLDFMMPEMDGLELAQRIKANPEFERIALILMTSDGLSDSTARYRAMGFSACLSKPLRQSELYDALSDAIGSAANQSVTQCRTQIVRERQEPEDTASGSDGVPGLRILLAEDNPVNQRVATLMLEGLHHRVKVVGDGKLAVEALQSEFYDAVLMDVQMPVMDGFEAVAVIRASSDDPRMRVPIIALTAHAMKGDRERCLAAGFDGYLTKPVRADAIREELKRLVPAHNVEKTPSALQESPVVFDRDEALSYVDGDEGLLEEILGMFFDDCPEMLSGIRSAAESRDAATLNRLADSAVAAASNIAAPAFIAAAKRMGTIGDSGDFATAMDAYQALMREADRLREAIA